MIDGQETIEIPKPVSPEIPPQPTEKIVVEAEIPQPNAEIPAIQNFLEVGLNINPDSLPQQLRIQYDELVGVIEGTQEMSDEEYAGKFSDFRKGLRQSEELKLAPEQHEKLDRFDETIASGKVTQEQVVGLMKGFVEDPVHGLKGEERERVLETIHELRSQISEPESNRDQAKIKRQMSKIFSLLKMGGLGLAALLIMGIFKAAKSVSAQAGGQRGY